MNPLNGAPHFMVQRAVNASLNGVMRDAEALLSVRPGRALPAGLLSQPARTSCCSPIGTNGSRMRRSSPALHQRPVVMRLESEMEASPAGRLLRTDQCRMTSVGHRAAGDIVRAGHNLSFAVADGTIAGISLHRALAVGA